MTPTEFRTIRESAGLTQQGLADLFGLKGGRGVVWRYEIEPGSPYHRPVPGPLRFCMLALRGAGVEGVQRVYEGDL